MDQRIISAVLSSKAPLSVAVYFRAQGITLKKWQFHSFLNSLARRNTMKNWGRGMSKTFMDCHFAVYTALFGLATAYCVPRQDQFDQAMKYFDANPFIEENPHKKGSKNFGQWYKVLNKQLIKLINIDDKGYNVSSGRFNNLILDESALLMYFAKEIDIYNKALGMLKAMPYQHYLVDSTPLLGSHFYSLKQDWEENDPGSVSWHNFQNTPDNFVSDTDEKMDNLMAELYEQRRMGIEWNWECENLAVPRVPGGSPFPNIIWDDFARKPITHMGFDFHGPDLGHKELGLHFDYLRKDELWIISESTHKYDPLATGMESVQFLEEEHYRGVVKRVETHGFNEGYFRDARRYGMIGCELINGKVDEGMYNLLKYHIHINKVFTPETAKEIIESQWDDPNVFKIKKEGSGKKWRNHFIDCLKNGAKLHGRGAGGWTHREYEVTDLVKEDSKRDDRMRWRS